MKPSIKQLTCRATTHLVSDARDRTLAPEEAAQLSDHLEGCGACRIASRQFEQLFAHLDTLLARKPEL
ncbi:zf-HC2 domain-containing protein [Rugamonas sp.]|uniref:zf-HC2 domain-containing protein n=1 Tax=Rugamonas sp. TaxID=1926287 RepID=UPI0025FA5349|nr:zf-HC2 domain-containing protein [Rugamonas sp.]